MNFPEQHEDFKNVFALVDDVVEEIDYDAVKEEALFFVALRTGKFSLLRKTPEFYDEVLSGITTREDAEHLLREHSQPNK